MAMTGFMHASVCYLTNADALDAYFGSFAPTVDAAGALHIFRYYSNGVWDHLVNLPGVAPIAYIPNLPIFPACDPVLISGGDLGGYNIQDIVFYCSCLILWAFGFSAGQQR